MNIKQRIHNAGETELQLAIEQWPPIKRSSEANWRDTLRRLKTVRDTLRNYIRLRRPSQTFKVISTHHPLKNTENACHQSFSVFWSGWWRGVAAAEGVYRHPNHHPMQTPLGDAQKLTQMDKWHNRSCETTHLHSVHSTAFSKRNRLRHRNNFIFANQKKNGKKKNPIKALNWSNGV